MIEYDGETKPISEWARQLGIPYKTLHCRIVSYGWDIERAFHQPVRKSSRYSVPNIQDG
jgi:hypothetical protein